ncbi:NUDIX domain-containing protein [Microbacterium sp. gxy059]|uniref:NUDIX domain-containing protein n=1 Tax=Microbacterium sp. gxy059 TaxID=2957199 RepID=UPI003D99ED82
MTSARPSAPRNPGDAWVEAPDGSRFWGRFGAAGLLAYDPERGVLLQHRVGWSHFGGTWGLPGGALHEGESPFAGALREAQEEAGVPDGSVVPRASHVFDAEVWRYTTVIADVIRPFAPVISDPESLELMWVPVDEVADRPLHPGFGAAWSSLREQLETRPVVLVDAANVVGSVPDGWWKDRAGAAARLRDRLAEREAAGVQAPDLDLPLDHWFPAFAMVVEGEARRMEDGDGSVRVVRAAGSGDDEIVRQARAFADAGLAVTVVTSDRELRERVSAAGAEVRGAQWIGRGGADAGALDGFFEGAGFVGTAIQGVLRAIAG